MAITKAQQARQMLRDGKRVGLFRGMSPGAFGQATGGGYSDKERAGNRDKEDNRQQYSAKQYTKPSLSKQQIKDAREFQEKQKQKIAQQKAIKEQQEKERKQRILDEQRRKQRLQLGVDSTTKFGTPFSPKFGTPVGPMSPKERNIFDLQKIKLAKSAIEDDEEDEKRAKEIAEQSAIEKFLGKIPSTTNILKNILPKDPFGKILGEIKDDPELLEKLKNRGFDFLNPKKDDIQKYKDLRQAGVIGAYGRPMGGFREGPVPGSFTSIGGEQDNQIIPQVVPTTTAPTTTTTTSDEDVDDIFKGELAARFGGSLFDFDKLRANAMNGGIMNTDVVGGFADDSMDEMGRQMYGLGKLVKKVTRGVKKIVKSPVGKAALLYGLGAVGGSFGNTGKFFSKGMFNPGNIGRGLFGITAKGQAARGFPELAAKKGLLAELGLTGGYGALKPTALGGIGLASLAAGALTPKQKQELLQQEEEDDFDLIASRDNPFKFLAPRFEGSQFAADGGRIGYQDGSKEPVAKKTMPLIDMDGMEKDYRETGGFVEMGRMERADDVPARLSKNEFVFTADAVRNAGDGNIDKGAEVMYNMMKNLEAGGEVSEESQGLEGARKMFQTSQRLGEVI